MEYFKVFLFLLSALVAVSFVHAQNNNTGGQTNVVTDGEITENEKSSLQKGMEGIFSLYQNFLETVMPHSFYDSDTPFNVQELNKIVKNNEYDELNTRWQDLVKTYGGVAACIICGFIFMVFMPIAGLIYCCCHCCCHKCGGTQTQNDPKRAGCMRATFAGLLLIVATLALVGCIITFMGAELLKKSLKNEGDEGLLSTVDTNIGQLQNFANSTIMDVKQKAKEQIIDEGLKEILPRVENAVNRTVENIKQTINATQLLSDADQLGRDAKTTFAEINKTRDALTALRLLQTDINNQLGTIKNDIDTACTGLPVGSCPSTAGLSFQPDFTQLDDLNTQLNQVQNAQQIDSYVQQARDQFQNVSHEVDVKVNTSIQDAKTQIQSIENDVNTNINSLDGKADPFIKDIQEGRDFFNDQQDTFTDIGNYTWYVCIGLGCAVLLVVLFYYMGVLFGLCGERPGHSAACCNRGTGANLLCAGIFFSFLFSALLMLVVIIMFSIGGVGYIMSCRYINDGIENVEVFETVLSDGFEFNISKAFNVSDLSISGMLKACKDNEGVYTALHLKSIFDIDKEFNTTDVEKQVRDMTSVTNFNLPNITLLSDSLRDELLAYGNTELSNVNFTSFDEQLSKPLTGVDIDSTIQELRNAANTQGLNAAAKTSLEKAADDLEALKIDEIARVDIERVNLRTAVNVLKDQSTKTTNGINNLIASIQSSQDNFNTRKNDLTKQGIEGTVNDTLDFITGLVTGVKNTIKNDIGKCRPLYVAGQNVADAVCQSTLDPFNAVWFGLGWSLFFYIPCIIFAAILSNLYQRSNRYVAKDKFDEPNYPGYAGYGGGRNDDGIPLTSRGGGGGDPRSNGSYNAGYSDYNEQVPESRYHRDGNYRDSHMHDYERPMYDRPMVNQRPKHSQYDSPPHYDEAVGRGQHGGYPKAHRY